MKILVIGLGPVGLSTAIGFANAGYDVLAYDINKSRIDLLKNGAAPICELDLQKYIDLYKYKITFTSDIEEAFNDTNIFFICVGTPIGQNNSVDMTFFWSAVDLIEKNVRHDSIIVIKSTVPIGTNKKVARRIERDALPYKITVASNPEFLAQGTSIQDTLTASRIVIGCVDEHTRNAMLSIYSEFGGEKIVTTPESAELIKYESNCYLAMRISFVNDLANTCELIGADVTAVLKGVSLDTRIGQKYFSPGLGYGGSCFPKDTICFHNQIQKEYGYELELIEATIDINKRQILRLCRKLSERNNNDLVNKEICVLGLSFKKDTDDVRNSLAVNIIAYLLENGARVTVWDCVAIENGRSVFGDNIRYSDNLETAVKSCDIVMITTDWEEIVTTSFELFKGKQVYDGRNCFLPRISDIDFEYYYIGGMKRGIR